MAERKRFAPRNADNPPSRGDIWQAATLLIGVYGRDAMEYADSRRSERQVNGDLAAAQTWNRIAGQIAHLLQGAPAGNLH